MRDAYRLFSSLLSRINDKIYTDYKNDIVSKFYEKLMQASTLDRQLQNNPNKAKIDNLTQLRNAFEKIMTNTHDTDYRNAPERYRVRLVEHLGISKVVVRDEKNVKLLQPYSFETNIKNRKSVIGKDGKFNYSPSNVSYADSEIRNLNKDFMEVQRNYDNIVAELCDIYESIKHQLTSFNDYLKESGVCDLFNDYMIHLPEECKNLSNILTIPQKNNGRQLKKNVCCVVSR